MGGKDEKNRLLQTTLKQVSRSFYLTLRIVPSKLRDQLGLAYLFCRAADTIADTDLIVPSDRLKYLCLFREQFETGGPSREGIEEIRSKVLSFHGDTAERTLLSRLEECFRIFSGFSSEDQGRIRSLIGVLTKGMEMDLSFFPAEGSGKVKALPSMQELDQYCYYVAGAVGEFWTQMVFGHLRAFQARDPAKLQRLGARFGKGLQMTNLLKDMARDLRRGRCYLPQSLLDEFKIEARELNESLPEARLRPVLARLIQWTLDHLEAGWQYILEIPRGEARLRLACLWPHLFAVRTLERIHESGDLLSPESVIKIPRTEVYSIMAATLVLVFSNRMLSRYYGRSRNELLRQLSKA